VKLTLVQRVVARFAGRNVYVEPMEMKSCRTCRGTGVQTNKQYSFKFSCLRCFGTGTDPDSVEALRRETEGLGEQYRKDYAAFEKARKPYRGRSVRQFGVGTGFDLQTLRITHTEREKQLAHEDERIKEARKRAAFIGAMAAK